MILELLSVIGVGLVLVGGLVVLNRYVRPINRVVRRTVNALDKGDKLRDKQYATILTDNLVGAGVHINAIGGDCPGKTELDPRILRRATVFVELPEQTRVEGEIQQLEPDFPVTELWRVLTGDAPGRTADDQLTIFDSVGFAIEDFAALTFLNARLDGTDYYDELDLIAEPADIFTLEGRQEVGEIDLYQRREKIYTRKIEGFYQRVRLFSGWPLLLGYLLLPWASWDGRQAVLFDLPARKFYILGLTFWPQDFPMLAFLLMIAAAVAGAGAEVEQVIRTENDLAVMLDQQQGVAEVAQFLECGQQPAIIARMQADGRLIEHI